MANCVKFVKFVKFVKLFGFAALNLQAPGAAPASRVNHESAVAAKPARLEGMPYLKARAIILRYGWLPFKGECSGAGVSDRICGLYPEIGNCTGNGIGFCDMSFYRQNHCLIVVAIGGAPDEEGSGDSKVRDVTFRRTPCRRQLPSDRIAVTVYLVNLLK